MLCEPSVTVSPVLARTTQPAVFCTLAERLRSSTKKPAEPAAAISLNRNACAGGTGVSRVCSDAPKYVPTEPVALCSETASTFVPVTSAVAGRLGRMKAAGGVSGEDASVECVTAPAGMFVRVSSVPFR